MSRTVYWSYPILPFGIVACTYFPTTFLKIAVYKTDHSGPLSKTSMITWSLTTFLAVFPCKKTMMRDYTSFVANEVVTTYLQTINWNNIWSDTDVNWSFFQIPYTENRVTNKCAPWKLNALLHHGCPKDYKQVRKTMRVNSYVIGTNKLYRKKVANA